MYVDWKTMYLSHNCCFLQNVCMRYSYLMSTGNPHYGYLLDQLARQLMLDLSFR